MRERGKTIFLGRDPRPTQEVVTREKPLKRRLEKKGKGPCLAMFGKGGFAKTLSCRRGRPPSRHAWKRTQKLSGSMKRGEASNYTSAAGELLSGFSFSTLKGSFPLKRRDAG